MVATAEDIFFLFKAKRRRLEEEEDEFYHTFVKRNRAYNKGDSYENAGIVTIAANFDNVNKRKKNEQSNVKKIDKQNNVKKLW